MGEGISQVVDVLCDVVSPDEVVDDIGVTETFLDLLVAPDIPFLYIQPSEQYEFLCAHGTTAR